jgi:hypothetical protein
MGILNRLFGRNGASTNPLVGCWQLVRPAEGPFEPTEVEFLEDGRCRYSVLAGDRWQIMKLTYRVEGDTLITDQPSRPREERTRFHLEPDGVLHLEFGGIVDQFRRAKKVAPSV